MEKRSPSTIRKIVPSLRYGTSTAGRLMGDWGATSGVAPQGGSPSGVLFDISQRGGIGTALGNGSAAC
jgi:hypothetical protein